MSALEAEHQRLSEELAAMKKLLEELQKPKQSLKSPGLSTNSS
jgi:hypothetical protein